MDLTTRYLGLTLKNPLIASASPLSGDVDGIRRLEDGGAGAIVLPSLFEEQIRHEERAAERLTEIGSMSFSEANSYFPEAADYNLGPNGYLGLVAKARAAVDIPVIASLNGTTNAGWIHYAGLIEEAGASAIELNIYRIASHPSVTGTEAEADCVALFSAVRERVRCPVAVKLHPHYSAFGDLARQLDQAGADGLVLFNRLYQPDIDLVRLSWSNDLALSGPGEIRLGLLWLSQLAGRLQHASLCASTGVETADEVIKYLLAGADAVMTASSILRHGPEHLGVLLSGLETWLDQRDFLSVSAVSGLLRVSHPEVSIEEGERGAYIKSLSGYRGPYVSH